MDNREALKIISRKSSIPGEGESHDIIEQAYNLAISALRLQIADGIQAAPNKYECTCPNCGSSDYLYTTEGAANRFCGQCGKRINWLA